MQIIQWLMRSVGQGVSTKPLVSAVPAGLRALQKAGLVEARGSGIGTGTSTYLLTPAGESALAEGTAARFQACDLILLAGRLLCYVGFARWHEHRRDGSISVRRGFTFGVS